MKIEIFKTGTHTDGAGNTRDWTEDDLSKIANSYNPQVHEAPVVIGHPKDNAPAYGWVEALKNEGGVLYATVKDLVPEFVDVIKKGLYKKRSISLYPDMSLKHIGFLGAVPPAIKGLKDIAFKDEGGLTVEFNADTDTNTVTINGKEGKNMKFLEWLKGLAAKEGVTLEDVPIMSNEQQKNFSEAEFLTRLDAELKKKELEFSEKVASLEEARKKKEAELKAREDALRAKEAEAKKAGIASFCEGLLKEGKLTPAMMKHGMGIQNFLEQIGSIETVIEFGEGDKKESQTPVEFMKSFLKSLPKVIEFGEVAGKNKDISGSNAGEKIAALTKKKMGENKGLIYSSAFAEVQKENPELAEEYAVEIRG